MDGRGRDWELLSNSSPFTLYPPTMNEILRAYMVNQYVRRTTSRLRVTGNIGDGTRDVVEDEVNRC